MEKWYKIHYKDEQNGVLSHDYQLESFNEAVAAAYDKIDKINEEQKTSYRVVGIYEILYDRGRFNKRTLN